MKKHHLPGHDQNITRIFELRRNIDHVFFKEFEGKFPLPPEMNFTQMKALLITGRYQPIHMTMLSRYMQLEKGSFTPVAAKLIQWGYLKKIRDEKDKRAFNLELTDKGKDLVLRFGKTHSEYVNERLKNLESSEQAEFFSLLDRLSELSGKMDN